MSNLAVTDVLKHMENLKHTLQHQEVEAELSIERYVQDRVRCEEMIRGKKIEIADGQDAIRWLDAEIDRLGRS